VRAALPVLVLALTLSGCDATDDDPVDFSARLSSAQVVPPPTDRGKSATAEFRLNDEGTRLAYHVQFEGLDLGALRGVPQTADTTDDLTKLHVHVGPRGSNGGHALNIFGGPAEDDADLSVDVAAGVLRGVWDEGDANRELPTMAQSRPLSEALALLCTGSLYLQAHTSAVESGEIRGQIDPTDTGACDGLASASVEVDLAVQVVNRSTAWPLPEAEVTFTLVAGGQFITALHTDGGGWARLGPMQVAAACAPGLLVGAQKENYPFDARTAPCLGGAIRGELEVPLEFVCECQDEARCGRARC
jgi:hypothetical protein